MNEQLFLGGAPVIGMGQVPVPPVVAAPSPWAVALVTSVVGATTGWLLDGFAERRSPHRRRRRQR